MKRYIIERELPGAGNLTQDQLQQISQKSCGVLHEMGPAIQWVESFVAADKIYCVYVASDEAMLRRHAERGGFPANFIAEVSSVIGPPTAGRDYVPGQ